MTRRRASLIEAVAFEWRYHTRQVSFVAGVAIFAFFGFFLTVGLGRGEVNANSPALIAEALALLSLVSIFPLTVFSASAILRDREHGMEEIVLSTAVGRNEFLVARFTGVMLAALTLMLCATAGMIAAPYSGAIDASRVGPFELVPYVHAFGIFVLPDILFMASLVFAIAAITRSAPASYVGSVVVYVLYFVAATLTNSPLMAASGPNAGRSMTLASLLDPIGLSAFFEQTRYWTVMERNTSIAALEGSLATNRILWTLAAFAVLAIVSRAYTFRLTPSRRRGAGTVVETSAARPATRHSVEPLASSLLQFFAATRLEIRLLVGNLPFLVLMLAWIAFASPEVWGSIASGEYGSAFLPTTSLVIRRLWQPLSILGTLAMIYWSAEAFWRERSVRIDPIVASTPVKGTILFASKLASLGVMALVIVLTGVATGIAIQLIRGGAPITPGAYLGFTILGLTPLLLFAGGCGVIHALSPNKYVGMLFSFVLAAYVHRGELVGIEHPLLRFASMPSVSYSDMGGLSSSIRPFAWIAAWWALVTAALVLSVGSLWRRHHDDSLRSRLRALFAPASEASRTPLAFVAAAAIAVGAFVFFNTNVESRWETTDDLLDWKADYEKIWGARAEALQPRVVAIETQVDIDPEERRLRVQGAYRLTNDTNHPISRVLFSVRRDANRVALSLDGAEAAGQDDRFGMHDFELAEPLRPGESTTMRFDIEYERRGFSEPLSDFVVARNGSLVMGFLAFPSVGYRTSYEIREPEERTRRGLPPRGHWGVASEEQGDDPSARGDWVTVDATISTREGQTVVGPGRLVRSWTEGGRAFFQYRTDERIPNVLAFTSARYDVTRARHAGVEIEIYSHPSHHATVPAILEAVRGSLDVFSQAFGTYPHEVLRIAEVPSNARFAGFATPGMILLSEARVFNVDTSRESPVDLVVRRVAHEVAHQWWGHHVVPASVDGGTFLTESLTKYAEALALERMRGGEQVRNLRAVELDRYLSGRVGDDEPPLYHAGNQPFLFYSKGLLVMSALQDLLGPDTLNHALKRLVETESGPDGAATTVALLDALYDGATPARRRLIDDWMKDVVLHDLAVESAGTERLPDGRTRVNVKVRAAKIRVVDGREELVAMDEEIGVAVYDVEGRRLVLETRTLHSGTSELSFHVEGEPGAVEIDPEILRLDRNRLDNVWTLQGEN